MYVRHKYLSSGPSLRVDSQWGGEEEAHSKHCPFFFFFQKKTGRILSKKSMDSICCLIIPLAYGFAATSPLLP